MKPAILPAILLSLALAAPAVALAQAAPPAVHRDMQGDQQSWINDPHMHAFFDLTVAAFAHGPAKVDRAKFEADARAIFRDFATSRGMNPDAMVEHLKLIPGQVIQIATDDPKVLSSYDAFVTATFGPQ